MQIVSILSSAQLNINLDLEKVAKIFPNSKIPTKTSPWLKFRLPPNNRYIAFYGSGKIIISGTKTIEETNEIMNFLIEKFENNDLHVSYSSTKILNIVCMTTIYLNKSLENIIIGLDPQKGSYEPEQFPGLIYKDFGVTFLLFSTGKLIITGLKDTRNADNVLGLLLSKFKL